MIGAFELQQPSKPSHEAIFTIVNLYLSTATCYLLAVVLKSVTTFIRFLSLTAETARSSSLILDPPLRHGVRSANSVGISQYLKNIAISVKPQYFSIQIAISQT